MIENPKTAELRRIDKRIAEVEAKLEELTSQRNQYREILNRLYDEQLDVETS